jgi:acyl dehydratase
MSTSVMRPIFTVPAESRVVRYAGASTSSSITMRSFLSGCNETVFAHGMLSMGLMGKMLTDWVGDGNLRNFRVRFVNRVWLWTR